MKFAGENLKIRGALQTSKVTRIFKFEPRSSLNSEVRNNKQYD